MIRDLGEGYELDDDPARVDREAVHRYLSGESYWARGRPREVVDATIRDAARVVGLYHGARQVGFVRIVSDGFTVAYVADVYVLDGHRGRGLGEAMMRFAVREGSLAGVPKWGLHTRDAQDFYRRIGFGEPDGRYMEWWNLPNDDAALSRIEWHGVVKPGRGLAQPRMAQAGVPERLEELVGMRLVPGTLNLELLEPFPRHLRTRYLPARELGADWEARTGQRGYWLVDVTIAGRYPAVGFQADEDGFPEDQLEVISPTHLRTALGLRDGDTISFTYGRGETEES